jgi:outer membrane protein assembly factor BamB
MSHSYSTTGTHYMKAQAKDVNGATSAWSTSHQIVISAGSGGKLKWSFKTGGSVESSPAIGSDGTIYVGSNVLKLYAINPDGSLKWSFKTGDQIEMSSPAIDSDGTIYVGSWDDKLYAIYGSGSLADTPWPMFHHDLRHSGRVGGP